MHGSFIKISLRALKWEITGN